MGAVVTISGYASKDATVREVSDKRVTSISIPNNTGSGDKKQTDWYQVDVWGKGGEYASKIVKGDFVVATGDLTVRQTEKGSFFRVNVSSIQAVKMQPKQEKAQEDDVPW